MDKNGGITGQAGPQHIQEAISPGFPGKDAEEVENEGYKKQNDPNGTDKGGNIQGKGE